MKVSKIASASLLGLPLALAAVQAGAAPIAGNSYGTFSSITNCTGSDHCKINNTNQGNNTQLEWGYETNWRGNETEGGSTLTAYDRSWNTMTPVNDRIIGELRWLNLATPSNITPDSFNANFTLRVDFSNPNTSIASQVFNLNIQNTLNSNSPSGDWLLGLSMSSLDTLEATLNSLLNGYGLMADDVKYSLGAYGGSFINNVWYNSEGNTSRLYITADFNELPTSVPEPATLALFSLGLLAVGFATRRRKIGN